MKKIYYTILCGLLISASSCKKYLDINDKNPNNLTTAGVDLILPQALAQTAATSVTFNSYGAWVGGFQANAGGFGGFGSVLTYNYTTSDNTGLWSQSYDNINDYQTVINQTTADGPYKNFNAAARIMKAFAYQRLVDVYGDLPYSQAVKGLKNLTPKYDKAEDIYKDLLLQIDTAVKSFQIADDPLKTIPLASGVNGTIDIVNGGDAGKWIALANTVKLRLLIRIQNVSSLAAVYTAEKASLSGATFVTTDVVAQPGYVKQDGKQNPAYNAYGKTSTDASSQTSTLPTTYAKGFYDGTKLYDPYRQPLMYQNTGSFNQLGYTGSDAPTAPTGGNWLPANVTSSVGSLGILKGPTAPSVIMLAAESYFLQAEGRLIGLVSSGSANDYFYQGMTASFTFLYKAANGNTYSGKLDAVTKDALPITAAQIKAQVDDYVATNGSDATLADFPKLYLTDLSLATTDAQRLEAIITQKWIALNYINSNESWAEYRRTGYPTVTPQFYVNGGNQVPIDTKYTTFASLQSTSSRPDKLPVRVLYPASEYSLNSGNAPSGINPFTSRIFWDAN